MQSLPPSFKSMINSVTYTCIMAFIAAGFLFYPDIFLANEHQKKPAYWVACILTTNLLILFLSQAIINTDLLRRSFYWPDMLQKVTNQAATKRYGITKIYHKIPHQIFSFALTIIFIIMWILLCGMSCENEIIDGIFTGIYCYLLLMLMHLFDHIKSH